MSENADGRRWWHGAVIYQLYVRSWRDSNDDGYGDLRGIIERLDYLSQLGVDAIWLSPTMPSPDEDWGYDVSDYTGVHPELGTLADLDELIEQAGQRNMRVLLDLVPNHTSSAHPWFADAASGREAAHRGYYVWADPKPDGGRAAARRVPGVDGLQPRPGPARQPLVRRRRAQDQAGAAGAGHPARYQRALLRRRDRPDRRRGTGRAAPRPGDAGHRARRRPRSGQDPDAVGRLTRRRLHRPGRDP